MDRRKEEFKEDINNLPNPLTATNISTPTDDDTSTESSDTFETWTLVNDKENKQLKDNLKEDKENRVEIVEDKENEEAEMEEKEIKKDNLTALETEQQE